MQSLTATAALPRQAPTPAAETVLDHATGRVNAIADHASGIHSRLASFNERVHGPARTGTGGAEVQRLKSIGQVADLTDALDRLNECVERIDSELAGIERIG